MSDNPNPSQGPCDNGCGRPWEFHDGLEEFYCGYCWAKLYAVCPLHGADARELCDWCQHVPGTSRGGDEEPA